MQVHQLACKCLLVSLCLLTSSSRRLNVRAYYGYHLKALKRAEVSHICLFVSFVVVVVVVVFACFFVYVALKRELPLISTLSVFHSFTHSSCTHSFAGFKPASKLPKNQKRNPGQSTASVEGLTRLIAM